MEMKNTSAAIQAYRHAIEVNKRDYRAWYGLGQTYEILKMPFYCLYYYRRAHQLRPNDSRMLVALGECYEKLNQLVEAKKCYWRAYAVGDVEKMALVKLAKLHEQLNESEQAAQCYIKYIQDINSCGEIVEHQEVSTAFRYLAQYYFKCKLWDEASACAQKCFSFNDVSINNVIVLLYCLMLTICKCYIDVGTVVLVLNTHVDCRLHALAEGSAIFFPCAPLPAVPLSPRPSYLGVIMSRWNGTVTSFDVALPWRHVPRSRLSQGK
ncbi:hypothetical protein FKM82_012415 [Ascaphus truei]